MKPMRAFLSGLKRTTSGAALSGPGPFDTPEALELNRARLDHLATLGLPLDGRSVLDVGCGVGHLAQFFVDRNCRVKCVDGREENVRDLRQRYPGLPAGVADVEAGLESFGTFDVVFCYGLLYHLENPVLGIRNMAQVCRDLLLIETLVCDSQLPVTHWAEEPLTGNQALRGLGSRHSPSFVKLALNAAGFPFVYRAASPPRHPDFEVSWDNSLAWRQHGHLIRSVFVVSRRELHNSNLIPQTTQDPPRLALPPLDGIEELPERDLLDAAMSLAYVRPLLPYPGWRFDSEWENPDLCFRYRRRIWEICRQRGGDLPLEIPWHYGLRISLRLSNDLSKQVFIGGCYEANELAFLARTLRPGMTVVDAGANEGLYTLLAARCVGPTGSVWAFEPSSREFDRLRYNVENNELSNVRLFRIALGDSPAEQDLLIAAAEHAGQSTLGRFAYESVGNLGRERVPIQKLDDLVQQHGLNRLDLLKVDVEGAEGRLLRGARNTLRDLRPLVLFEVLEPALLNQGDTLDELLRILREACYSVWRFSPETGLPVLADGLSSGENLLAVPLEKNPIELGLRT
jgi:FkbM family methyltransferase